jgi:dihydroxyacetone kinase
MLAQLLDMKDEDRAFLEIHSKDQVVLLVNNLGGVSVLEIGGITTEVVTQLEKDYGIKPIRLLSGTYMTSLNGLGFSITLLKVTEAGGKTMLELLDAPAEATGWPASIRTETWETTPMSYRSVDLAGDEEILLSGLKRKCTC